MPAGRYAPSPSGTLHLGNLRTAILAWLFARHSGRPFLLRIEDLDRVRSGAETEQLEDLAAIGITWDAEPVRQSERIHLYVEALATLGGMDGGLIYECFCTRRDIAEATSAPHLPTSGSSREGLPGTGLSPSAGPPYSKHQDTRGPTPGNATAAPVTVLPPGSYPGTCRTLSEVERERRRRARPAALRIDAARAAGLPDGQAPVHRVTDRLKGTVQAGVDDFVLRRNDGAYAYNLAVVVDDLAQGVDQVVRGDDLLSSTPRQDWLARLLSERTGRQPPQTEYVHVPLVLNAAGQRLAKRDGAVTLADLMAQPGGRWSPERVRDLLLDSLGLPAGPLERALEHFDPDDVPDAPWTPPQTVIGSAGTPEEKIRFQG
ncbi:tRNA glutamyl-Q(34) synthetase GluQRS [Microbacterium sp. A93]|uniref:tRNA glutamyl-Q(34) synthetase GluQRS n=1 Tax=Microbacterium sp. A93 TaxID=3450716 RepID=UPI003F42E12D